ncbi:MAG TPA: ankyrin repeat domain-containing protein [Sphingobacteriaceae bacterium]
MSQALLEEYIQSGNTDALGDLLTKNPALATQKTSFQISPLMLACYYKKTNVSDLLLSYVAEISFFEASAVGKFDVIAHLLYKDPSLINSFSADGFTALGLAAYFGQEEITRYLLLKGADPNIASKNGYQVYPIHSAVAADHNMIAKMLMEAGADVNVVQMKGITPLHSAAANGNIELLILLLEAGANVNAKTEDGMTPSDLAAEKGFRDIARILAD